jgi:hypothetical protein
VVIDINDFFIDLMPEVEFPAPEAPVAFAGLFHGEWYAVDYDRDWWTTTRAVHDQTEWFPCDPPARFKEKYLQAVMVERSCWLLLH